MSDFSTLNVVDNDLEPAVIFSDITPADLPAGPQETWAIATFKNTIYLAWLSLDVAKKRDIQRIFRYSQVGQQWDTVFQETISFGRAVRRNEGEISVTFATAVEQKKDILFFRFLSPQGLRVLKTGDGSTFVAVEADARGSLSVFDHAAITKFDRKQYAIFPSETGTILRTKVSATAAWKDVKTPKGNISSLLVFAGRLVIAIDDELRGFELLARESDGTWKPIISRGGQRFTLNGKVFASLVWQGALYLVCGCTSDLDLNAQPGFELLRVYTDWSWDVVIGALHITSSGLKIPLTGIGPGTDEFEPATCMFLQGSKTSLLLGTYEPINGLRIWSSQDGDAWSILPNQGMGGSGLLADVKALFCGDSVVLALLLEDMSKGRFLHVWKSA